MKPFSQTRIIITLGPATSKACVLEQMVRSGVSGFRINCSHGTHAEYRSLLKNLKTVRSRTKTDFFLMADLQGPKIRLGDIPDTFIRKGDHPLLCTQKNKKNCLHVNYAPFTKLIRKNSLLFLNDGLVQLKVEKISGTVITTKALTSGMLSSRKGVNIPDARGTVPVLDQKDLQDLDFAVKEGFDYLALSFVRDHKDILHLKRSLKQRHNGKPHPKIIAKIEKPEAVRDADRILQESDGVIVARGDLGIEMDLEQVILTQKEIAHKGFYMNKPVITATQMLESMINNSIPTRAEVSDISNAVLDGCDALLLTGETSVGKHPLEAVRFMKRIITRTENSPLFSASVSSLIRAYKQHMNVERAIGLSIYHTVNNLKDIKAVVAYTFSGFTALTLSKFPSGIPIYAFTPDKKTLNRMGLYQGVQGFFCPFKQDFSQLIREAEIVLKKNRLAKKGEQIIIAAGHPLKNQGITNMMKVHRVS